MTVGDITRSRCYRVTTACLSLLCVLVLAAVTVLWIKFNNLTTENNQLQTSYNTLVIERDQLKIATEEFQRLSKLGWKYSNSSFYYVSTETKSWTESRYKCRDSGADLVIINSSDEQDFISKTLNGTRAWIGLNDRDIEDEWKWVDGTSLSIEFWGSGEPNSDAGNEDCVLTGDKNNPVQTWADYPCQYNFKWICEKKIFK